jgi:Fic family protein
VQIKGELQKLLSQADRALGRLDGSIQTLPNPDLFVFMYVRKEAVLSSQIEGTQSSLQDLLAAEAQIAPRGLASVERGCLLSSCFSLTLIGQSYVIGCR